MLGDLSRVRIILHAESRNVRPRRSAFLSRVQSCYIYDQFMWKYLIFSDIITDVSLVPVTQDVVEGGAPFTLSYSSMQGPVMTATWYFKGSEVANDPQYLITQKGLIINQPNRNDTGLYSVVLTNPFSNVTQSKTITVLCKFVCFFVCFCCVRTSVKYTVQMGTKLFPKLQFSIQTFHNMS